MNYLIDYSLVDGVRHIVKRYSYRADDISEPLATTPLNGDEVVIFADDIYNFIEEHRRFCEYVNIQNDADNIGVIVDIFDESGDLIDTACFWFDDYIGVY